MQINVDQSPATFIDRLQIFLLYASLLVDSICVAYVLARKVYRVLPIFVVYLIFSATTDALLTWFSFEEPSSFQLRVYVVSQAVEYLLEFGILFELAATVLRLAEPPLSLSRMWRAALVLASSIGLLAFSTTGVVAYHRVSHLLAEFFRSELTVGVTRCVLFLLLLAIISQVGIPRRATISRITVILSLYFAVAMFTQIAHEVLATRAQQYDFYERIECVRSAAWCLAMILISVYTRAEVAGRPWWVRSASNTPIPIDNGQSVSGYAASDWTEPR